MTVICCKLGQDPLDESACGQSIERCFSAKERRGEKCQRTGREGKEGDMQGHDASTPAGSDVVRPENSCWHVIEGRTGQPKITDLELAVAICQDILGLEVAVEHLCSVNVLQPSEKLVEEELVVLRAQVIVGLDNLDNRKCPPLVV